MWIIDPDADPAAAQAAAVAAGATEIMNGVAPALVAGGVDPATRGFLSIPDPPAPRQDVPQLLAKLQAAMTANNNYLAIPSPTAAQAISYTQTAARELNGLIRLVSTVFGVRGLDVNASDT